MEPQTPSSPSIAPSDDETPLAEGIPLADCSAIWAKIKRKISVHLDALPAGFDYMPDAEAGICVRALPAEAVTFDFVQAQVPSAVEPGQWSAY